MGVNRRSFLKYTGIAIASPFLPKIVFSLQNKTIDNFVGYLRVEVETEKQDNVQTPEVPELSNGQLLKAVAILGCKEDFINYLSKIDSKLVTLTPDQFKTFLKSISSNERKQILTLTEHTDLDERIIKGEWDDNIIRGDPDCLNSNMEHLRDYNREKVGAFLSVYKKNSRKIYPVEGFILTPNGKIKVNMNKIAERELNLAQELTGKKIEENKLDLNKKEAYKFLTGVAAETVFSILDYESEYRDPITSLVCKNVRGVNFAITTALKRHFDNKKEPEPADSKYRFPVGRPQYVANYEFADDLAMRIKLC